MVSTHLALSNQEKHIHELLIGLAELTRTALQGALEALLAADTEVAARVIADDEEINRVHHQVTEQCFVAIALRQPVANDLRDLIASMQIAAELERIGDYAADISRTVVQLEAPLEAELRDQFEQMGRLCERMLSRSMDVFQEPSVDASTALAAEDDIVDKLEEQIRSIGVARMQAEPAYVADGMHAICVAHKLERTADRVTNIAERIVFMSSGEVVELD